jgi:LAGLIDADG endonuclease
MLLDLGGAQRVVSLGLACPARVCRDASVIFEAALELLRQLFGCGYIIEQHRRVDHRWPLLRYSVKRRSDLVNVIVPFFVERPLITAKQLDFERFCDVSR